MKLTLSALDYPVRELILRWRDKRGSRFRRKWTARLLSLRGHTERRSRKKKSRKVEEEREKENREKARELIPVDRRFNCCRERRLNMKKAKVVSSIHMKHTEPRDARSLNVKFLLIDVEDKGNRKKCSERKEGQKKYFFSNFC